MLIHSIEYKIQHNFVLRNLLLIIAFANMVVKKKSRSYGKALEFEKRYSLNKRRKKWDVVKNRRHRANTLVRVLTLLSSTNRTQGDTRRNTLEKTNYTEKSQKSRSPIFQGCDFVYSCMISEMSFTQNTDPNFLLSMPIFSRKCCCSPDK